MNKIIKWGVIGVASIVLIIIFAGMYKFNYLASQTGYDVDGNKIEYTNSSEVLLKWFNLSTSNDFYVKVPDTNIKCKITELIESASLSYAKGIYSENDEKGEVFVYNSNIISLNQSTKDIGYFVIPFSISNQGSGFFKYLGLFKIDYTDKTINQIDSYFLGDRIKINSINYNGADKLQIELNNHSENQAMSEIPSELKTLNLMVVEGNSFGFMVE